MGEMLTLTAEDGHRLSAYRAMPAGKPRGGIVVVQEIFGVNSHIKKVTDGFAADGYVALAPALFDRVERDFETGYAPADIERAGFTRGARAGAVGLSTQHTLAIVAHEGARARDVIAFARRVQDAVDARFGVMLTPEPVFWGV